jgi:imidazolonepropionase-like amidohydrolase
LERPALFQWLLLKDTSDTRFERPAITLPQRGEFVITNAYVITMDPQLGDIPNGSVHVRNGAIVAVGAG